MPPPASDLVNVVWYKRDLRTHDHAPLAQAAQNGLVIPLYIVEPDIWELPDASFRQWSFIADCLRDLHQQLRKINSALIIRRGNVIDVLAQLHELFPQFTLWSHEETGNQWTYKRDLDVAAWCRAKGIIWHELPSNGVVRRLATRDVWSKLRNARMAETIVKGPDSLPPLQTLVVSDVVDQFTVARGQDKIITPQKGGRSEGLAVLDSFITSRHQNYLKTISKPGVSARHSSRLSTHIAYGTLSVREIEQRVKTAILHAKADGDAEGQNSARNLAAFLSRLAWRCHFVQKLEQQPQIETHCIHPAFEGMREPFFNEEHLAAWKNGTTGYPLVDACMRSLIVNGWINFRMRAMLVSFASYHLCLDWRQTAPYLAGLFTDYEPGIHYAQMQMQSGVTGMNAIRIYSPLKQSIEHDPQGHFIRRYVPELAAVSPQWIHEPWRMNQPVSGYPAPIVAHQEAIKKARALLAERRGAEDFRAKAKQMHQKLGSRQRNALSRTATTRRSKKPVPQLAFHFGGDV